MEAGTLTQGKIVGVPADTVVNKIHFELPSLPGSLNEIYELNRHDSGLPRKRLKVIWSLWITRMLPYIPAFSIAETSVLRIDRIYYFPWFTSKGTWRRVDAVNFDALLFNLVTRKIGVDDSRIKAGMLESRDSSANKVEITLTEVLEKEWKAWQ